MFYIVSSLVFGSCIVFSGCSVPLSENTEKGTIQISQTQPPDDEENSIQNTVIADDILIPQDFTPTDTGTLSEEEKLALIYMREEEKLAHDVYLTLYDIWGKKIFQNISASETTHTDTIASLIQQFGMKDPVKDTTRGIFQNPTLQTLYNNLVEQGKKSLLDALIIGATVEDLDIQDLENYKNITKNPDILRVYENLQRGSRNHLRSFVKNISSEGGNYSPQFISQTMYQEIISGTPERGNGGGMGKNRN